MVNPPPRVRVGPSFKRPLTIGALRLILFNYLAARHGGGSFVIRIEDTDRARLNAELMGQFFTELAWLGVDYDEGGRKGGPYGPYTQSERVHHYHAAARALVASGHAYRCFCPAGPTPEARGGGEGRTGYDGRCAALSPAVSAQRAEAGEPHVVRMRVPREEQITFADLVFGEMTFAPSTLDDQVLLKSDGYPTYHLSSVVDDHLMAISPVIRSSAWLASTPKHILLYRALGWAPPQFAHVPPAGSGFETEIPALRAAGLPGPAVVDFTMRLGWHGGRDDHAPGSLAEAAEDFRLSDLSHSCGDIDQRRLMAWSAHHLRRRTPEQAAEEIVPFLRAHGLPGGSVEHRRRAVALALPHLTTYGDAVERFRYLWAPVAATHADDQRDLVRNRVYLADVRARLRAIHALAADGVEQAVREAGSAAGFPVRQAFDLLRLAICGARQAPNVAETVALLGVEEADQRLANVIGVR